MSGAHGAATRLSGAVARVLPAGPHARLYLGAILLVIALGVALRLVGYFGGIEFWWDEALWANRMARETPRSIRPLGYIWISQWLIGLRNTEPVIRSVSLLAGLLSLPVFLAMCRRAGLSRLTSLFGLFVLAVHPGAVDLTKEFKPYALELFLQLLLLWLAFSFLRTQKKRWLVWTCLVAATSPLFSWSVVVLFPGLFVILAAYAFRRRQLPQLLATVAGGAVTASMCLTAYWLQFHGRRVDHVFWGHKYHVFYTGPDIQGHLQWLLETTYEVASFPARLEPFWLDRSAVEVFAALQVALCLLGVITISAARRWDWAGLWLSPWMVTIGLNLLGWWPYGVFRTNLFLLAYSLLVALAGLDGLRRWIAARQMALRLKGSLIVPVFCSSFVVAFLPLDIGFFAEGKGSGLTGNCHVHRALEVVYEAERDEAAPARPRRFLVDHHARDVYLYYRNRHAVASKKYKAFLRERYRRSRWGQTLEEGIDKHAERGFWLLACRPDKAAAARQYALARCPQVDHLQDFRHGGLLLRCRGGADRLSSQRGGRGGR